MKDNVNNVMMYITMWQQVDMKNNKMCFSMWLQIIVKTIGRNNVGAGSAVQWVSHSSVFPYSIKNKRHLFTSFMCPTMMF